VRALNRRGLQHGAQQVVATLLCLGLGEVALGLPGHHAERTMKRVAPSSRQGGRFGDVRMDLTPKELEGIGAIALAFNEVEFSLGMVLYFGLNLPANHWLEIIQRIGNISDKVDLAKDAATEAQRMMSVVWQLPAPNFKDEVIASIGKVSDMKTYRDTIIHCRVFNRFDKIGERITYKARIDQILLTESALNGVYDRLCILSKELELCAHLLVECLTINNMLTFGHLDAKKQRALPFSLEKLTPLRESHAKWKALPPLPEFPVLPSDPPQTG